MRESTKTNQYRSAKYFSTYLSGSVLDIGCGNDPVVPHAQPFDMEHGDANKILEYLSPESFDAVHSSHCLEHMRDVPQALQDWWQLVRPEGYMIVVVPHEDLYEQGFWPSLNNTDHKATFRLTDEISWSPVSHNLRDLANKLDGVEIVDIRIQDSAYNHGWSVRIGLPRPSALKRFFGRMRHSILKRINGRQSPHKGYLANLLNMALARFGIPIDQTKIGALAQIQCVLRKNIDAGHTF